MTKRAAFIYGNDVLPLLRKQILRKWDSTEIESNNNEGKKKR